MRMGALGALFVLLMPTLVLSSEPPAIIGNENLQPRQPQMAIDRNGAVHLVFGSQGEVYHCSSIDEGRSFSSPIQVGQLRYLSLGMRRGPRIVVAGKAIVVSAIGGELGGGRDGDLFAWKSVDGGKTWDVRAQVNDVTAAAREGLHSMATDPNGLIYCAWLDLRNHGTEIAGSSSYDGGRTWSKNNLIYRSPDGRVCECCHPSLAFAADGKLLVMWRNSLKGERDMYVTASVDSGKTFDLPRRLGTASWPLDACPMDGGSITVDERGLHAAWRRGKAVFLTDNDTNTETEVGQGEQPWLAVTRRGTIMTWLARRPGDLFIKLPSDKPAYRIANSARDPVVIGLANYAVVAWETVEDKRPIIKVQRDSLD